VAEHINLRLHLCLLQTTLNAIHTFTWPANKQI